MSGRSFVLICYDFLLKIKIPQCIHSPNNTGAEHASWESLQGTHPEVELPDTGYDNLPIPSCFPDRCIIVFCTKHCGSILTYQHQMSGILIFANAMDMKWYLIVLTYISLIIKLFQFPILCQLHVLQICSQKSITCLLTLSIVNYNHL